MPQPSDIADDNEPNQTSGLTVKPNSMTCAGGCPNHETLTTVFYTPILILFGGFAALATFPEIAEYAAPWIDEPVSQHVCPSVNRASSGSNSCGLATGCSNSGCSTICAVLCETRGLPETSDVTIFSEESTSTDGTLKESAEDVLSHENIDSSANVSN